MHRLVVLTLAVILSMSWSGCRSAPRGDARWEFLRSGSEVSLRGLHVLDRETVWATGSGGTVLRSTDGGDHFELRRIAGEEGNEIRDVHGFSADEALVMACQPARIYRTLDGGRTYQRVLDAGNESAFFDGLSFFDRAHGIVFGDPLKGAFAVFVTDDGGVTWTAAETPPAALPGEGGFAASGTCLAVHPDGRAWIGTGIGGSRVLRSEDWGRTFVGVESGLDFGSSAGVFSIAFRDRNHGVAVGGDYVAGHRTTLHAATTSDGGQTWRLCLENPPRGFRSCVVPLVGRPGMFLAVGPTGTDLSVDDGRTWAALNADGFHVVSVAADGACFAAGSGGRMARLEWAR